MSTSENGGMTCCTQDWTTREHVDAATETSQDSQGGKKKQVTEKYVTGTYTKCIACNANIKLFGLQHNTSTIIKEKKAMTNTKFRGVSTSCWGFNGTGGVLRLQLGAGTSASFYYSL